MYYGRGGKTFNYKILLIKKHPLLFLIIWFSFLYVCTREKGKPTRGCIIPRVLHYITYLCIILGAVASLVICLGGDQYFFFLIYILKCTYVSLQDAGATAKPNISKCHLFIYKIVYVQFHCFDCFCQKKKNKKTLITAAAGISNY